MAVQHFKHAIKMMAEIKALTQKLKGTALQLALQGLEPYKSRGHGRGDFFARQNFDTCTDWKQELSSRVSGTNGPREMARRVAQRGTGGSSNV